MNPRLTARIIRQADEKRKPLVGSAARVLTAGLGMGEADVVPIAYAVVDMPRVAGVPC